jgi:hypothetical protein
MTEKENIIKIASDFKMNLKRYSFDDIKEAFEDILSYAEDIEE